MTGVGDRTMSSIHLAAEDLRTAFVPGNTAMTGEQDAERRARVALSFLANPGDAVLGAALGTMSASQVLAATIGSDADGEALLADRSPAPALARAIGDGAPGWAICRALAAGGLAGEWAAAGPCPAILSGLRSWMIWAIPGRCCCGSAAPPTCGSAA